MRATFSINSHARGGASILAHRLGFAPVALLCGVLVLPDLAAAGDGGAAAGASAVGTDNGVMTCPETLGTISLEDNQAQAQSQAQPVGGGQFGAVANVLGGLTSLLGGNKAQSGSEPTVNVSLDSLRLLIQESNCFIIVERHGGGDAAAQSERNRVRDANSEIRDNSNFQKGQEYAADYALVAHIESVGSGSRFNLGLAGLVPGKLGSLFGANAGTSLSQADVMLVLDDLRTNAQVSIAKGRGESRNLDLAGSVLGRWGSTGGGGESVGFHSNTPNGKLLLQAYADAYKKIVPALTHYVTQTVKASGGPGTGGGLKMQGSQPDMSGTLK
jgi:hypothetical protein